MCLPRVSSVMAHRSRAGATQVGVTRAGAEESSARANGCAGGEVGTYIDCGHRNTSSSNGQAVRTSASKACALLDPGAGGLYVLAKASCKSGDRASRVLTSPHDGRAPNPFRAWHSKAEKAAEIAKVSLACRRLLGACGNPVRGSASSHTKHTRSQSRVSSAARYPPSACESLSGDTQVRLLKEPSGRATAGDAFPSSLSAAPNNIAFLYYSLP